ncbi:stAR-related lipid transfer protein 7, mitochondrial-like [Artemia franciscana]|uniref:stAR-related lipid transfer protein 7, mitochondrial-like n=1 Tax=Artemia franciscana TaxID=6661 RepID=UPI0032DA1070
MTTRTLLRNLVVNHGPRIIKSASFHCECITNHRVKRSYQVYRTCRENWGPKNFHNLLTVIGKRFLKQAIETQTSHSRILKSFLVAGLCASSHDWERDDGEIISDVEVKCYSDEMMHVQILCEETITCKKCCSRIKFDQESKTTTYCCCPNGPSVSQLSQESPPWSPYLERPDLIIWRHSHHVHKSLYVYKVYGKYNDVSARNFFSTQLDTEYRRVWDSSVADLRVVESFPEKNMDIIYWEMEWPRMFANRDYVFVRRYHIDYEQKLMIVVNKSYPNPKVPPKQRIHRVNEYYSVMVIKPLTDFDEPGIEFSLTYFDNPGLSLPQYIVSWVAATGLPDFLGKLREAAKSARTGVSNRGECSSRLSSNLTDESF